MNIDFEGINHFHPSNDIIFLSLGYCLEQGLASNLRWDQDTSVNSDRGPEKKGSYSLPMFYFKSHSQSNMK